MFRAADPVSFGRTTFDSLSIGGLDLGTGELIVHPENAHGHSGGVVEVDGKVVGLLSRRMIGEPLCRVIPPKLFLDWLRLHILDFAQKAIPATAQQAVSLDAPAYQALLSQVRAKVVGWLVRPWAKPIAETWGADPVAGFDPTRLQRELDRLLQGLYRAVKAAIPVWEAHYRSECETIKEGCWALWCELLKLAIDPAGRAADLAEVAAGRADQLYFACQYEGTAEAVYCLLRNLTHGYRNHAKKQDILADNAVHLDDELPVGAGEDLRQAVMKKLWKMVMPKDQPAPGRIDGTNYEQLVERIKLRKWENREYLPAAFLRRCLVLTLKLPAELQPWLMEMGRLHLERFGLQDRTHPAILAQAAAQLAADRRETEREQRYAPGLDEYLDMTIALARLGETAQRQGELLEKVAQFALRKAAPERP